MNINIILKMIEEDIIPESLRDLYGYGNPRKKLKKV